MWFSQWHTACWTIHYGAILCIVHDDPIEVSTNIAVIALPQANIAMRNPHFLSLLKSNGLSSAKFAYQTTGHLYRFIHSEIFGITFSLSCYYSLLQFASGICGPQQLGREWIPIGFPPMSRQNHPNRSSKILSLKKNSQKVPQKWLLGIRSFPFSDGVFFSGQKTVESRVTCCRGSRSPGKCHTHRRRNIEQPPKRE